MRSSAREPTKRLPLFEFRSPLRPMRSVEEEIGESVMFTVCK